MGLCFELRFTEFFIARSTEKRKALLSALAVFDLSHETEAKPPKILPFRVLIMVIVGP